MLLSSGLCRKGSEIRKDDLSHEESRHALDIILERTMDFHKRGLKKDILTVDNHVDGHIFI